MNGQNKGNNLYLFLAIACMCTGFLLPVGIFMGVLYLWGKYFGEEQPVEEEMNVFSDEVRYRYS